MRFHAVASLVSAALLAAIIAAFPASRARGQGATPPSTSPPSGGQQALPAGSPTVGTPGTQSSAGVGVGVGAGSTGAGSPGAPAGAAPTSTVAPAVAPATASNPTGAPNAETSVVAPPPRMVASLSHDLQFGLGLMFGGGYRGIFPYASSAMIVCGDAGAEDNRVCTARAPVFIDVQPSFGISHSWDFLVDLRLGIEKDFNQFRQFYIMPGFRYWLDVESRVKFFTTIQLAYDRSKQNDPAGGAVVGDTDLGFRNSNGLMVEIMRNFGVYAQFGETIGFYRWLSFLVDAGIGIQVRVP